MPEHAYVYLLMSNSNEPYPNYYGVYLTPEAAQGVFEGLVWVKDEDEPDSWVTVDGFEYKIMPVAWFGPQLESGS